MKNRINEILALLIKYKQMDVADLAKQLQVSQVTIRKDLTRLESTGMVRREHGCALLHNADDITGRLAYHYEAKQKIAVKAAQLVHDGDTIMIESGSCCTLLAAELAATRHNLTIITNSIYIAHSLRQLHTTFQIILLGGIYQQTSECLVGPMVRNDAENYHVRLFFIGTDGYSAQYGFTNRDSMRAQAVRDMAHACDHLIILTESEKFQSPGTVPLNVRHIPRTLITDDQLPAATAAELKDSDLSLQLV